MPGIGPTPGNAVGAGWAVSAVNLVGTGGVGSTSRNDQQWPVSPPGWPVLLGCVHGPLETMKPIPPLFAHSNMVMPMKSAGPPHLNEV
jgi:hypothetical protein